MFPEPLCSPSGTIIRTHGRASRAARPPLLPSGGSLGGVRGQNPQVLLHVHELRLQPVSSNTIARPDRPVQRQPGRRAARDADQRRRRPRKPDDNAAAPLPVAGATVMASWRTTFIVTGGTGAPAIERSSADPGVTLALSGTTPAFRIRSRTAAAWAGVCRVITVPAAPALAVRPDRCR